MSDSPEQFRTHNRQCTDPRWLVILFLTISIWACTSHYAYTSKKQYALKDFLGRRCGLDENVKDKPYVFLLEPWRCSKSCVSRYVCVRRCPKNKLLFSARTPNTRFGARLTCSDEKNKNCSRIMFSTRSTQLQCLPDLEALSSGDLEYLGRHQMDVVSLQRAVRHVYMLNIYNRQILQADFKQWLLPILTCLAVAVVISFLLILLLAFTPMLVMYSALFILSGFCTIALFYFFVKFKKKMASEDIAELTIFYGVGIVSVFGLVAFFFILKLKDELAYASRFVCTTIKLIRGLKCCYVNTIVTVLVEELLFEFGFMILCLLVQTGEWKFKIFNFDKNCRCTGEAQNYNNGVDCNPHILKIFCTECNAECSLVYVNMTTTSFILLVVNLYCMLYMILFVRLFSHMALAGVYSEWYWNGDKTKAPLSNSIWKLCRYHAGTACYGLPLVPLLQIIKSIGMLAKTISEHSAVKLLIRNFFFCYYFTGNFVSRYTYIICMAHGTNYCQSSRTANELVQKTSYRARDLDTSAKALFFAILFSTILIEATVSYVVLLLLDKETGSLWMLLNIVIINCVIMVNSVVSVFNVAASVVYVSFLEEFERNQDKPEKVYRIPGSIVDVILYEDEIED